MRPLNVFFVIGATALAPAAEAQEPGSRLGPLLDVPADYQALKPLPTDWPRPSDALNFYRTRYNMGATGPVNLRRSTPMNPRQSIEVLRGLSPSTIVVPDRRVPPAAAPAPGEAAEPPQPDQATPGAPDSSRRP